MTSNDAALLPVTPRGTRPRNRRDQIRSAAAALFYERGYEQVSIADVAESVNVGPSALYRHFSGKADLLFEAIDQIIGAFADMVADLPDRNLEGIARTAARTAIAYRPLGVLWQREARNLPEAQLAVLRRNLRDAVLTLAGTLREIRPELDRDQAEFLAACGVNAMSSISFHRLEVTEELLTDLATRVLSYGFTGPEAPDHVRRELPAPASRREEIADAAAALFARHGYDAVGVDDIGAAVGIAGPSIYSHFTSKQDLLFSSLGRAYGLLQGSLADALETSAPTAEVLHRVLDSYVDMTYDHSDLVTNLIAESRNLGDEYQETAQKAQLGYIGQWVSLIHELRPDEDAVESRIKVQSAQMMANSVSRTLYLRSRPGFRRDLGEICWLLLA
ncbi:TetR/AcrR family transcriptional regulator [Nocardioides marmorisolisilvae]|uniref:TetR/AcrR family transcriptional regulator n=1 Tax=Nocardioides marmorisolisilvae TaxID=1542737 RepID=A0A3N0DZS7_9ACTN|nr:TetR/AcrR family transcriptional regulator [Nocardioides marmorisolisilvae]RNL81109.1 TetR/AcrR family transcriptional regulator [Nocardioides marmorisolisilvae]